MIHLKKLNGTLAMLSVGLMLSACSEQQPATSMSGTRAGAMHTPVPMPQPVSRPHDFATVMHGGKLFQKNCASCHGQLAQGAPQWQKPDANGKYPAPPLNGTGHAWHHPLAALKATIKRGTVKIGGNMPAWGDKLSDDDIESIIAWLQAQWPDEIYRNWLVMDERARKGPAVP